MVKGVLVMHMMQKVHSHLSPVHLRPRCLHTVSKIWASSNSPSHQQCPSLSLRHQTLQCLCHPCPQMRVIHALSASHEHQHKGLQVLQLIPVQLERQTLISLHLLMMHSSMIVAYLIHWILEPLQEEHTLNDVLHHEFWDARQLRGCIWRKRKSDLLEFGEISTGCQLGEVGCWGGCKSQEVF